MKINLIETLIQTFNPNYRAPLYVHQLKAIREHYKVSKSDFAASLGYIRNPIPYYLIEAGLQTPTYQIIRDICLIYKIDANWFLGIIPGIETIEKGEESNEN